MESRCPCRVSAVANAVESDGLVGGVVPDFGWSGGPDGHAVDPDRAADALDTSLPVQQVRALHAVLGLAGVVAATLLALGQIVPRRPARPHVQVPVFPLLRIVRVMAERFHRVPQYGRAGLGNRLDGEGRVLPNCAAPPAAQTEFNARLEA